MAGPFSLGALCVPLDLKCTISNRLFVDPVTAGTPFLLWNCESFPDVRLSSSASPTPASKLARSRRPIDFLLADINSYLDLVVLVTICL